MVANRAQVCGFLVGVGLVVAMTVGGATTAFGQVAGRAPDSDVLDQVSGFAFNRAPVRAHLSVYLDQRSRDLELFTHGVTVLFEAPLIREQTALAFLGAWGVQLQSSNGVTGLRDLTLGAKWLFDNDPAADAMLALFGTVTLGVGRRQVGSGEDVGGDLGFLGTFFLSRESGIQFGAFIEFEVDTDLRVQAEWFTAIGGDAWVLHLGAVFNTRGAPAHLYLEGDWPAGFFFRVGADVGDGLEGNLLALIGWVIPIDV